MTTPAFYARDGLVSVVMLLLCWSSFITLVYETETGSFVTTLASCNLEIGSRLHDNFTVGGVCTDVPVAITSGTQLAYEACTLLPHVNMFLLHDLSRDAISQCSPFDAVDVIANDRGMIAFVVLLAVSTLLLVGSLVARVAAAVTYRIMSPCLMMMLYVVPKVAVCGTIVTDIVVLSMAIDPSVGTSTAEIAGSITLKALAAAVYFVDAAVGIREVYVEAEHERRRTLYAAF